MAQRAPALYQASDSAGAPRACCCAPRRVRSPHLLGEQRRVCGAVVALRRRRRRQLRQLCAPLCRPDLRAPAARVSADRAQPRGAWAHAARGCAWRERGRGVCRKAEVAHPSRRKEGRDGSPGGPAPETRVSALRARRTRSPAPGAARPPRAARRSEPPARAEATQAHASARRLDARSVSASRTAARTPAARAPRVHGATRRQARASQPPWPSKIANSEVRPLPSTSSSAVLSSSRLSRQPWWHADAQTRLSLAPERSVLASTGAER